MADLTRLKYLRETLEAIQVILDSAASCVIDNKLNPDNLKDIVENQTKLTSEQHAFALQFFSNAFKEELRLYAHACGEFHAADIVACNIPTEPFNSLEEAQEAHASAAYDAEENKRQYAGFSYLAGALNASPLFEELWQAFEEGVASTIAGDLTTFTSGDYNIAQKQEA